MFDRENFMGKISPGEISNENIDFWEAEDWGFICIEENRGIKREWEKYVFFCVWLDEESKPKMS